MTVGPILIIAPHPDDEAIGCGGAICLHRRRGEEVHVVFLTSGERGIAALSPEQAGGIRETEARNAGEVLGVQRIEFLRLADLGLMENVASGGEKLAALLRSSEPSVIYLPHPIESHPDHHACLPLVRCALRQAGGATPELRGYEVWTPMPEFDWPEDITDCMKVKLRAIRCYESQLRVFRYDHAVRGLNRYRGALAARCQYAEVFRSLDPSTPVPDPGGSKGST